jgi:hypothetical protein
MSNRFFTGAVEKQRDLRASFTRETPTPKQKQTLTQKLGVQNKSQIVNSFLIGTFEK